MWPRKQIDVGAADIAYGMGQVLWGGAEESAALSPDPGWIPDDEALVCLSVRSGFDLLLTALGLPPGSEIVVSAVTIPDMVRIIEHHGCVAVPVDVDLERLEVSAEALEAAITPRTRAVLVAHLFGSRMRMEPLVALARRHRLVVIEDCAQAYVGRGYAGHSVSDVALFSFGPIKTATALSGAVLRVRNPGLLARMRSIQAGYPRQRRTAYLARLLKYAALKTVGRPKLYGALVGTCRRLGVDYDRLFSSLTHGFSTTDFFRRIRHRPCGPLVAMLRRRIARFDDADAERLERRTQRGERLARQLEGCAAVPGSRNPTHTYWVVPLLVTNRAAVRAALRKAGFDAADRSSLVVVPRRDQDLNGRPRQHWLNDLLFLPDSAEMPAAEFDAMCRIVESTAEPRGISSHQQSRESTVVALPR